jgi:hypothetical protein
MWGLDDNEEESSTCGSLEPVGGYEIGFGKPPAAHRFKPGQSGNPRGRRKMLGIITLSLLNGLNQKICITKGTVEKNVSKEEAVLRQLINRSLKGDWRAFMALMRMGVKLGLVKPIKMPDRRGGVVKLPIEYWYEKKAEWDEALAKEIERRDALFAQGLYYDR